MQSLLKKQANKYMITKLKYYIIKNVKKHFKLFYYNTKLKLKL